MIPKVVLLLATALGTAVPAGMGWLAASEPISPDAKANALAGLVCAHDTTVSRLYFTDGYFVFEGERVRHEYTGECKKIPSGTSFRRIGRYADPIATLDENFVVIERGVLGNDTRTWYHANRYPISTY